MECGMHAIWNGQWHTIVSCLGWKWIIRIFHHNSWWDTDWSLQAWRELRDTLHMGRTKKWARDSKMQKEPIRFWSSKARFSNPWLLTERQSWPSSDRPNIKVSRVRSQEAYHRSISTESQVLQMSVPYLPCRPIHIITFYDQDLSE